MTFLDNERRGRVSFLTILSEDLDKEFKMPIAIILADIVIPSWNFVDGYVHP